MGTRTVTLPIRGTVTERIAARGRLYTFGNPADPVAPPDPTQIYTMVGSAPPEITLANGKTANMRMVELSLDPDAGEGTYLIEADDAWLTSLDTYLAGKSSGDVRSDCRRVRKRMLPDGPGGELIPVYDMQLPAQAQDGRFPDLIRSDPGHRARPD